MQIISFLGRAFTFTFGPGYRQPDVPLENIILNRLPTSLTLTFLSIGLATIVGLTLGSVAAFFRNTWIDYVVSGFSLVGQVIPVFVIAIFFKYLFAVQLKILPSLGWGEPKHAVLPVLAFSLGPMGGITRFMRASMVSSLASNYVRTAYSKGLPRWRVVARHCIPNSLIPVVTIAAPQVATGLLGIVFIEQIFGIAGVGLLFGEGYNNRDYPQVVATIYILSLAVMLANLVADILYSILDPRIRIEG
jgi:peptide/nickel transport system permease protein